MNNNSRQMQRDRLEEEITMQGQDQNNSIATRRSRCQIRASQRYDFEDSACSELVYYTLSITDTIGDEPTIYQEAISSSRAEQ